MCERKPPPDPEDPAPAPAPVQDDEIVIVPPTQTTQQSLATQSPPQP